MAYNVQISAIVFFLVAAVGVHVVLTEDRYIYCYETDELCNHGGVFMMDCLKR